MKEKEFIDIIKNIVGNEYIGDDCAFLKDLGIVVTQDSLVEGVHFLLNYTTPHQLGYKSVQVNLSDIYASGGEPKYITISLSLPPKTNNDFIKDFYKGIKDACGKNVKVIGGDITGAEKVFISICAIGITKDRNISSRSNAKIGYKVITAGLHGSSAAGLKLLQENSIDYNNNFVKSHLIPIVQKEFANEIALNIKEPYAMMDTSDGLMDALSTIANESNVLFDIDFEKIPHDKELEKFKNWQNLVLFGGEDYGIVAAIPEKYNIKATTIGYVKEGLGVNLKINNKIIQYSKQNVENNIFNHFSKKD